MHEFSLELEFEYIGIHVDNLDNALRFFADYLQLDVLERGEERNPVLLGCAGVNHPLGLARLRFPETRSEIRLIGNPGAPLADGDHANQGTCHVCFYTGDLDSTWAHLADKGTRLCSSGVIPIKGGVFDGGKCIYCVGPDGFRVEFLDGRAYLDGSVRDPGAVRGDRRANEASHIGLHVRDRDRSLAFYRDALGIEEVAGWLEATASTREVIGYPNASLWMSILRLPGTQSYFEVIEYRGTDGVPIDNSLRSNGACHLSFRVNSLDAVLDRMDKFGALRLDGAPADAAGRPSAWFEDPDGYRVCFVQDRG